MEHYEDVVLGNFIVHRYGVIGTTILVYSVWEPDSGHSTISSLGDSANTYGRVGTRPLPNELKSLPAGSGERCKAVGDWQKAQYDEAYSLIEKAFPHLVGRSGVHRSMGCLETYDEIFK